MEEYIIYWTGTVSGRSYIKAESLAEAIKKAEDSEESIDIEEYPSDWSVVKDLTESFN